MLRNRFLGSTTILPLYAPPDPPSGAAGGDLGDVRDQSARTSGDAAGDATADGGDGSQQASGGAADAAASGDGQADGSGEPPAGATPQEKKDWRDKEIARKHRQLQDAKRENEELRRLIEAQNGGGTQRQDQQVQPTGGQQPAPQAGGQQPQRQNYGSKDEFDRAVAAAAAQSQLERDLDTTNAKGIEVYGRSKWDGAMQMIATLGGFEGDEFLQIMATDDPARVLYELGANPEAYQNIKELPPHKRQAEFIKIALAKKAPSVSQAPAPVDQVGSRGGRADDTELRDDLPEDEWRRRRMIQKSKSQGRPWSPRQAV